MKLDEDELSCLMCGKVLYLEYRKLRIDDNTRTSEAEDHKDATSGNGLDSPEELAGRTLRDRRTPQYTSTMVRPRGLFRN